VSFACIALLGLLLLSCGGSGQSDDTRSVDAGSTSAGGGAGGRGEVVPSVLVFSRTLG